MGSKLRNLEISTAMGCSLNCKYCPQKLLLSKYYEKDSKRQKYLKFEDFKTAIKNVEQGGIIHFAGMVEPFQNPECADMIKYAYESGYRVTLFTTLMGMRMKDFEKIKDVKLDQFVLHIPDKEGNSHFIIDEEYKKLLTLMQETFDADKYSCHGTVHPEIVDLIDNTKYAGIGLVDRAGNLDIDLGEKIERRHSPFICITGPRELPSPHTINMHPDGTLVACCMDYGCRYQFGNLVTQSWEEIAAGREYVEFKRSWEDDSIDNLCRNCVNAVAEENMPSARLRMALKTGSGNLERLNKKQKEVFEKLKTAKEFLIWGSGAFYKDHYKYFKWDETFEPVGILDSNETKWGEHIDDLECYNPEAYDYKEGTVVVIFTKKTAEIEKQLGDLGVPYVRVEEVFRIAALL